MSLHSELESILKSATPHQVSTCSELTTKGETDVTTTSAWKVISDAGNSNETNPKVKELKSNKWNLVPLQRMMT